MNGGRLSNDETFLLGVAELRAQLQAAAPDGEAALRALARIAVRYPEEAEQLGDLWRGPQPLACAALLAQVETQHQAENED